MDRIVLTADNSAANAATYTTASYTPGANQLVLVFVSSFSVASIEPPPDPRLTGNGLSWELVTSVAFGSFAKYRLACFRAMGAAPTAGTLRIDYSSAQGGCAWSVFAYNGAHTGGANGSDAAAQPVSGQLNPPGQSMQLSLTAQPAAGSVTAGGIALELVNDPNEPISPVTGFVEIHEQSAPEQIGASANMQTQDRDTGGQMIGWTWGTAKRAGAIALEIKAAPPPPPPPGTDDEKLVRQFEPVLVTPLGESWVPSDPKRFVEAAALWTSFLPGDSKKSWGGTVSASFPRAPAVAAGHIRTEDDGTTNFIGHPGHHGDAEPFLELGGWKDKSEVAQAAVTDTSSHPFSNRDELKNRYQSLKDSRFWYYSEVIHTARLRQLADSKFLGLTLAQPFVNPTLLCYYLFFPAHEQGVSASVQIGGGQTACTNVEAREVASFVGHWGCVAILLDRADANAPFRPTHVGFTGLQTPYLPGKTHRAPQGSDGDLRTNMKVAAWDPDDKVPRLPERDASHPRFYVAAETHSLYLTPGSHKVAPYEYEHQPSLCGRVDTPSEILPEPVKPADAVFWAKIALAVSDPLLAWELLILEGYWPNPEGKPSGWLDQFTPADVVPDDVTAASAAAGLTIRPAGVAVGGAHVTEEWRSRQGHTVGGRTYDYLVDRTTQKWWPSDDKQSGFRGRWGQHVESDPLSRRAGMTFPDFWYVFLKGLEYGKTMGEL
ncbi:hypothetical protein GV794_23890 [Nocardia cyriacigeorgica]|uniref:Uncharacterized protein n=1 Tax=Nocardia cyriacigeorgica TaxID=135487 RepID=A0ABX0CS32_9NOCA|nr:hypothetical protein [Nocardia cyriacigeorgica]NEW58662.1 hypothetical protein [Nocardia cyriacigeorgica]